VTVRPEFAASLATDPLTLAAMAQFDQDVQTSQQAVLQVGGFCPDMDFQYALSGLKPRT